MSVKDDLKAPGFAFAKQMETDKQRKSGGVFWLIGDELLAIPYVEGAREGLAKSGRNYNHRRLWNHVKPKGCNREFDYYPRGRVEIDGRGRAVIYMSPYIDKAYVSQIMEAFGITGPGRIHYDGSRHYQCHFDRELY